MRHSWRGTLCLCLAFSMTSVARPQTSTETGAVSSLPSSEPEPPAKADDLDKLLELADKDVSQLSQVKVAGVTGSASLDMPVSTVSRQESTVGKSPAAVFVITNEMIRRSGAKEIPEVLRMVPGLAVEKIDSSKWSVTVRGFGGRFASKLLVRIDGRDVYTPLYGGVFWDVQDVLLEDVERIEVIRGPGATVWGANAVNGVINIITKSAKDTKGAYAEAGGGNYQRAFTSARYGGQLAEGLSYRLYGKWFDRAPGYSPIGYENDTWNQGRGGFRMDWTPSAEDTITFQGDGYSGVNGETNLSGQLTSPYYNLGPRQVAVSGANALVNWRRKLDEDTDWAAKVYYDHTLRNWWNSYGEDRGTFDFDFQYRCPLGVSQELIWGLGYRNTRDVIHNDPPIIVLTPAARSDNLYSCFVQDEITLSEDLWYLTVGSKFERNDYTGFECQPSIRLLWTPDQKHSLWTSVSRAVRTPARCESDVSTIRPSPGFVPASDPPVPIFPIIQPNPNPLSEELIAYEAGIRGQPTDRFSWDLAVFFNDYQRLSVPLPGVAYPTMWGLFLPLNESNVLSGHTYGFEVANTYQLTARWRLQAAYTFLVMDLRPVAGTSLAEDMEGSSPRNLFYLQSSWDLGRRWELDLVGRYSDNLPALGVPEYIVGDARLAWRAHENLELSVVGRNLLNGRFYEFGNDEWLGSRATAMRPEVYGQVIYRY